MIKRILLNSSKLSLVSIPFLTPDTLDKQTKTESLTEAKLSETGWDRVKSMFEVDEVGNLSDDIGIVLHTTSMSLLVGALYGGFNESRQSYMNFMQNNQATKFRTHLEAKAKLQEEVVKAFGKGAFKWGWRLAAFSSCFIGLSTVISVYRGDYGIAEYSAAGAVSGFLYKFNAGPRGWIVGTGLGCALGTFCGCTTYGILKLAGVSMDEVRYWSNYWKQTRNEHFRKGVAKYMADEDFAVIKIHDDEVGEAGKDIRNLEKDVKAKQ